MNISIAGLLLRSMLSLSALDTGASGTPVTVKVLPQHAYADYVGKLLRVSCDFQLANSSDEAFEIEDVRAKAFGSDGSLMALVKVDSNGGRRSIEVLGPRRIEPKSQLTVFNPFLFDTAVPVDRLTYEFRLRSASNAELRVTADVRPQPYRQRTRLVVPLRDARLWAYDGPGFLSHHRRVDLLDPFNRDVLRIRGNGQRYAVDLVVVDRDGSPFHGDPHEQENWLGFGVPIVAPAAGMVVEADGSLPDDIPFDEARARENPMLMVGNHVVIDHGNGEFSLLAHFRQGSVRIRKGQHVAASEVLGAMGHSGMGSGLVHLHYQLQNGPGFFDAEGLPARLEGFRRIGSAKAESGEIEAGWILETGKPQRAKPQPRPRKQN